MKLKKSTYLLIVLLIINAACKKNDNTKSPESFASTTYKTLGSYDTTGKPYNLLKDTISTDYLSFINSILPSADTLPFDKKNLVKSHPELFVSSAMATISLKESSDVYMTFVSQGAGYKNSIGFYTYPTGQPPLISDDVKTITYAFPSAGNNTPLKAGDKIKLGRFEAGTTIGFVVMQDGWNSTTKMPDNNVLHFCSNDVLNPEKEDSLKRHAVLIKYEPENKLIFGFEDLLRTLPDCDNDFNDVVFYCTVNP
jgi:uncharacterized protein DUF4114